MKNNTLAFFIYFPVFGWVLTITFYGPVLSGVAPAGLALPGIMAFLVFNAATYLIAGIVFKGLNAWKKLIAGGLTAIVVSHILFILPVSALWIPAMAMAGVSFSLYILGWSVFFSFSVTSFDRVKVMAVAIVSANAVTIMIILLANYLPPFWLMAVLFLPLLVAIPFVLKAFQLNEDEFPSQRPDEKTFPASFLAVLCLFIFLLYFNTGYMFNVLIPSFQTKDVFSPGYEYYRYLPYILALFFIFFLSSRSSRFSKHYLVYLGISMVGFSFLTYAFLGYSRAGFFITTTFIEIAFASLNIFIWTLLGDFGFAYRAPYRFFGLALMSLLAGTFAGHLVGGYLYGLGEDYRFLMALSATAVLFFALPALPWLMQKIDDHLQDDTLEMNEELLSRHASMFASRYALTVRESEVIKDVLIFRNYTNKELSARLYISENTLKTHLKNIYRKLNVSTKEEIYSLAIQENEQDRG